jgi:hypothetical protein
MKILNTFHTVSENLIWDNFGNPPKNSQSHHRLINFKRPFCINAGEIMFSYNGITMAHHLANIITGFTVSHQGGGLRVTCLASLIKILPTSQYFLRKPTDCFRKQFNGFRKCSDCFRMTSDTFWKRFDDLPKCFESFRMTSLLPCNC